MRFGIFEVNLETGEVRRAGVKVRLQEQPFQVLAALLEKPGEIVTKEDLQERIWKDDTYVDFDRSLATAINKVRQALEDSATRPRFIETVPKRGYRFIGLTGIVGDGQSQGAGPPTAPVSKRVVWALLGAAAVTAAVLLVQSVLDQSERFTFSAPRPLTTDIGYEVSPSFSPDGNQIVYAWDGPDQRNFDLYVKQVGSSARRQLTDTPTSEYSPTWSPDGLRIAFARATTPGRLSIYVMPAIGGPETRVGEVASGPLGPGIPIGMSLMQYPTVSWTPDGEWLLTTDHEPDSDEFQPVLLSVETGLTRPIGEGIWGRTAAISPSGDVLALVARNFLSIPLRPGFEPGGNAEKLASFTMALGRPAWTPDSKHLLVTGVPDDESLSVVRLISLDGSPPRRILELGNQVAQQTVSAAGRLAYVNRMNDHNIWTVDLPEPSRAGQAGRLIASTYADLNPEFSADGSKIVFVSSQSGDDEIWVTDHDGRNPLQVTHSGEEGVGSPTWSPDGDFIAYDGYAEPQTPIETSRPYFDWDIWIIRSDGGGVPKRLTWDGSNSGPSWSRDSEWIYFRNGPSRSIYRVAANGGQRELVAENAGGLRLSPDGRWVYFKRTGQIWRKPVGGGVEAVVLEEPSRGSFGATNNDLYFIAPRSADGKTLISHLDLATSIITPVYQTPKWLHAWLDVSADGKRLIFNLLDQQGSDIYVVDDFWR